MASLPSFHSFTDSSSSKLINPISTQKPTIPATHPLRTLQTDAFNIQQSSRRRLSSEALTLGPIERAALYAVETIGQKYPSFISVLSNTGEFLRSLPETVFKMVK